MRKQILFETMVLSAITFSVSASTENRPDSRPNIIFILADDMGWMDSSTYGSDYFESPGLDALARSGVLFTRAYGTPQCSPTRASLMTGEYASRHGIYTAGQVDYKTTIGLKKSGPNSDKMLVPENRGEVHEDAFTIAEALKGNGYTTGFFGKWHLGRSDSRWPLAQGFDVNVGGSQHASPLQYFSPYFLPNITDGPDGEHITDRLTEETITFIKDNKEKPFFICLWHYSVHGPWQSKEELTEKYKAKSDVDNPYQNPIYAGMLESMDQSTVRILETLEKLKLDKNTVIIFMSDNGGLINTPDANLHSPPNTPITSNLPLRGGKSNIYEGGIRVPLVISWPGKFLKNTVNETPVSCVDIYPTILDISNTRVSKAKILDGESLTPLLNSPRGKLKREAIYAYFPAYMGYSAEGFWNLPATSVHQGDWKLICFFGDGNNFSDRYELYNLKEDIGETTNLAYQFPEVTERLANMIHEHLQETKGIVPERNPKYREPITAWSWNRDCDVKMQDDIMEVALVGQNPLITSPEFYLKGPLVVSIRARRPADNESRWQSKPARPNIKWREFRSDDFNDEVVFDILHDDQWRIYEIPLISYKNISQIVLNPGIASDSIEIDYIMIKEDVGNQQEEGRYVMWNYNSSGK